MESSSPIAGLSRSSGGLLCVNGFRRAPVTSHARESANAATTNATKLNAATTHDAKSVILTTTHDAKSANAATTYAAISAKLDSCHGT